MTASSPKPPAMWQLASKEVQTACRNWRLKLNRNYEWIRIREVNQGQTVRTFALTGLRWTSESDIRRARDLCLQAEQQGHWPEDVAPTKSARNWQWLAEKVAADIVIRIPKKGSHRHFLGFLHREIAKLDGALGPAALEAWISRFDPLNDYHAYLRRLDMISQINRAVPELGLEPLLTQLRAKRRHRVSGSAAQLLKVKKRRVRLIPETDTIEDWLLGMNQRYEGFPFNQYLFALIATYGLRPHEVWHVRGIDQQGWITVPGGAIPDEKGRAMLTKTGHHVVPPSPAHWVELFNLREGFARFQELLHERYPVEWQTALGEQDAGKAAGPAALIPVNNVDLGLYVNKLLTRSCEGFPDQLFCTPEHGGDPEPVVPYDLRHAYAVRLLSDPLYALVPLEQHADWMGHDLAVHSAHYHRWIGHDQLLKAKQQIVDQCNRRQGPAVVIDAPAALPPAPNPESELELLRAELARTNAELEQRNQVMAQIQAMMGATVAR